MAPLDVNLYLVGFMGTGKTTVARAVAVRLGFQAIDSDHEIERARGKPVARIFDEDGEPAFREAERTFIESGHPPRGQVVACGGGLVVQPGMRDLLRTKGVVICLHASLETILRRTEGNANRPLLNVPDRADRIRELYAQREPAYLDSGPVILTDGRPLLEVANHVVRTYRGEANDWLRTHGAAG
jgi:shikimate kinase